MKFSLEKGNLFDVDEKYYLAHCISDDFAMGAGIAVEFENRFNLRSQLRILYPKGMGGADCAKIGRVFNLVTKEKYWHKPTLKTLEKSLNTMRQIIIKEDIKYIAMPKIGSGLDRLNWNDVQNLIIKTFDDLDVDILIKYM